MNVKLKGALLGLAAMLTVAATNLHAQTGIVIAGSSALYLEAGQAAATNYGCVWSTGSKIFSLTDTRITPNPVDKGAAWIAWEPGSTGCGSVSTATGSVVVAYINLDSTIGARCFFANPRCTVGATSNPSGTAGANKLAPIEDSGDLPAAAFNAINGTGLAIAASDIRAEDSKFATLRVLTACGVPVQNSLGANSQYLGIGFTNGSTILGATSGPPAAAQGGSFNVMNFNLVGTDPITGNTLPASYVQLPAAVTPVLVIVNPSDGSGFGSLQVSNITSATLAGYLDGTYGSTGDVQAVPYSGSAQTGTTVYIREPLSGTYNTMEYNVANTVENQSSMDVGLAAIAAFNNQAAVPVDYCQNSGGTSATGGSEPNPFTETLTRGSGVTSNRYRVIGTGNMVAAVEGTPDSLGYSFWSAANFGSATASTVKYLTVDGIDPLQQVWTDGEVPTSGNGLLGDVSLAHIRDGSYPIWGEQEFISDPSGNTNYTVATTLQGALSRFLSPTQPDFVPYSSLEVVRSHFAPPGVTFLNPNKVSTPSIPCNGSGSGTEAGGSVGGMVYTYFSEGSYNNDNGLSCGNVAHRR